MLKINKRATLAALILLNGVGGIPFITSAEAQSVSAKAGRCSYYDPRPKCTEDYRNATRKEFGLPTLSKIRQRNGYAGPKSDLIVATVSFKRAGGIALVLQRDRKGAPTVEIRQLAKDERPLEPKPISVKIPEATWDMIIAKGKALAPVYATDEMLVCGATFTVEMMDERGNVHAPVGDSCGNEPRGVFFEALAEAALAQLPHCAATYPDGYDPRLNRLSACFALSGQQMAAAELFNQLEPGLFWNSIGKANPSEIRLLLEDRVIFSWPGIPLIEDAETAAEFWAGDWLFPVELQHHDFYGETRDRVVVTGFVLMDTPDVDGDKQVRMGRFTSIWQRGKDGQFRMFRFENSGK